MPLRFASSRADPSVGEKEFIRRASRAILLNERHRRRVTEDGHVSELEQAMGESEGLTTKEESANCGRRKSWYGTLREDADG